MTDEAMLPPEQVRADYNRTLRDVQGEYVRFRWMSSPIKRRHYRQTRKALEWAAQRSVAGTLLEVGCGPAVWTPLFLTKATAATLVDISDEMLAGARHTLRERPDVSYVRADFADAPLQPESFDTAVSIRAFEYMPDKPSMLRRFASLLRPGGHLVIVTKNAGWRDHRNAQRAATAAPAGEVPREVRLQAGVIGWETLADLARQAGLHDITITPVVLGSYEGWTRWWPGLPILDLLHGLTYRRAMQPALDGWTESVMLQATR